LLASTLPKHDCLPSPSIIIVSLFSSSRPMRSFPFPNSGDSTKHSSFMPSISMIALAMRIVITPVKVL